MYKDIIYESQIFETQDVVVVADIFRFSTTAVALLGVGASAIIPHNIGNDSAKNITLMFPNNCIDLGSDKTGKHSSSYPNSPSVVIKNPEIFNNKVCLMTTSKGAASANVIAEMGAEVVIGSFLNLSATAKYLRNKRNVYILATEGRVAETGIYTEDQIFAVALLNALGGGDNDLNMTAQMAFDCYGARRFKVFKNDFPFDDLLISCQIDKYNFVAGGVKKGDYLYIKKING